MPCRARNSRVCRHSSLTGCRRGKTSSKTCKHSSQIGCPPPRASSRGHGQPPPHLLLHRRNLPHSPAAGGWGRQTREWERNLPGMPLQQAGMHGGSQPLNPARPRGIRGRASSRNSHNRRKQPMVAAVQASPGVWEQVQAIHAARVRRICGVVSQGRSQHRMHGRRPLSRNNRPSPPGVSRQRPHNLLHQPQDLAGSSHNSQHGAQAAWDRMPR